MANNDEYEPDEADLLFVNNVVNEYISVLIFRALLEKAFDNEEKAALHVTLMRRASRFTEGFYDEDSPRNNILRDNMRQNFDRILGATFSTDKSWEE